MPSGRHFIPPTSRGAFHQFYKGRLYASHHPRSAFVSVPTLLLNNSRTFVIAEGVLGGHVCQPYVHDVMVNVHDIDGGYDYRVFFKRHKFFLHNRAVGSKSHSHFRGEVAILLTDPSGSMITDMTRSDIRRVDFIITRIAHLLTKRRVPEQIQLGIPIRRSRRLAMRAIGEAAPFFLTYMK